MKDYSENLEREMLIIQQEIKSLQILIRVNNLMLSRFILQLQNTRKELGLPKRETFFKFELLEDDYLELVNEFGKDQVDKSLYRLDRLLLRNKQNCPHNIKKYIRNRLRKKADRNNNE
jgi:hypothetical protein